MSTDIFLDQILQAFVLVHSNTENNAKWYKDQRYYLLKGIIKNYNVIINNSKNFYDLHIDSDIKRYAEIGNSTAGHSKDYTTGYLLDNEYISNHYRLIAVNLSRQK